ncbi:hypothetical protein C7M84_018777 [Penaeus vannamei]|uniref:C2 domain-containing protein n=1 Tax=Penaeus vannamei TaxID=6689 RepID=A0A423SGQ8_PENVA|nr:hypothetical protein C7M84_018777 [Penaeus vannamei]
MIFYLCRRSAEVSSVREFRPSYHTHYRGKEVKVTLYHTHTIPIIHFFPHPCYYAPTAISPSPHCHTPTTIPPLILLPPHAHHHTPPPQYPTLTPTPYHPTSSTPSPIAPHHRYPPYLARTGLCREDLLPHPLIRATNAPDFDQKFSFDFLPEDLDKRLLISVWSRDTLRKRSEFLGCMSFSVAHISNKKEHTTSNSEHRHTSGTSASHATAPILTLGSVERKAQAEARATSGDKETDISGEARVTCSFLRSQAPAGTYKPDNVPSGGRWCLVNAHTPTRPRNRLFVSLRFVWGAGYGSCGTRRKSPEDLISGIPQYPLPPPPLLLSSLLPPSLSLPCLACPLLFSPYLLSPPPASHPLPTPFCNPCFFTPLSTPFTPCYPPPPLPSKPKPPSLLSPPPLPGTTPTTCLSPSPLPPHTRFCFSVSHGISASHPPHMASLRPPPPPTPVLGRCCTSDRWLLTE